MSKTVWINSLVSVLTWVDYNYFYSTSKHLVNYSDDYKIYWYYFDVPSVVLRQLVWPSTIRAPLNDSFVRLLSFPVTLRFASLSCAQRTDCKFAKTD